MRCSTCRIRSSTATRASCNSERASSSDRRSGSVDRTSPAGRGTLVGGGDFVFISAYRLNTCLNIPPLLNYLLFISPEVLPWVFAPLRSTPARKYCKITTMTYADPVDVHLILRI